MKTIGKLLLIAIITQFILHTRADARGEAPPPPPFMGGNAGDWLGSGPIFGFEEPSLRNPWMGGGSGSGGNSDPIGSTGGARGGSNGGWGGAWWEGRGPLGGGGWGGWGGWGSGLGVGSGTGPGDTTKKGYLWPNTNPVYSSCWRQSETGGYSDCLCIIIFPRGQRPALGSLVTGKCQRGGGSQGDPYKQCPGIDAPCTVEFYP